MKPQNLEKTSFETVESLARRLSNLIRLGVVVEADYASAKVRVKYGQDEQGGDLISGWLPWLTNRAGNDAEWDAPENGEQVLMISPSGELRLAVVMPALYQSGFPAPADAATVHRRKYADGAVIEYDRAAHRLKATLPSGGSAVLSCPAGVQINANTTINGDVTINGNNTVSGLTTTGGLSSQGTAGGAGATINGAVNVSGGDVNADGISLKGHTHPGDSGGTTGQPQ